MNLPLQNAKDPAVQVSAGVVLVEDSAIRRALVIRVRQSGYEIPKGHVEPGETVEAAARRELIEETALLTPVTLGPVLGTLSYSFEHQGSTIQKAVHYFAAIAPHGTAIQFGARPPGTRELRWITGHELASLPVINEDLRAIIQRALELKW